MEREIKIQITPEGNKIKVDVKGVSWISSEIAESLDGAIENTQNKIDNYTWGIRKMVGTGTVLMGIGTYLWINGFYKESMPLLLIGTALATAGATGVVAAVTDKRDRLKELAEELSQLKAHSNE